MRETRLSGSEGGGARYTTGSPYPYPSHAPDGAESQSPPQDGFIWLKCYENCGLAPKARRPENCGLTPKAAPKAEGREEAREGRRGPCTCK
jgi:hypothetical protein